MLAIRTILHPTDFSDHSMIALHVAGSLARLHGANLIALHVVGSADLGFGEPDDEPAVGAPPVDRSALEEQLRRLQTPDLGIKLEARVGEGDPVSEILRTAEELQCELIVLGTRGRADASRMLLGSVAEAVARRARCAVVTVRGPARAVSYTADVHHQPSPKD